MGKLDGKIALITGGGSGMGLATAKLYKQEGATVIITARTDESFKQTSAEYGKQFEVIKADVSKVSEVRKLFEQIANKHKKIDVVFANAGIGSVRPTELVDEDDFDSQFNTNVKGLYFTIQQALPLLNDGSSVILNASVVAAKGYPGMSVYSATKAAVRSLARTWAAEYGARGIRFNVLSPGPIDTPIFGKMGLSKEQADGFKEFAKTNPLGRMGRPEEMASVALFLASADSSYVTGLDLLADGGAGSV